MKTFITDVLKEYIKANNLPLKVFSFRSGVSLHDLPILFMRTFMEYECGIFPIDFLINEKERSLHIYSIMPVHGILETWDKVSELLYELNVQLQGGIFSVQDSNGEIRFETRCNFKETEPTADTMDELIRANLDVMSSYVPAFVWVMFTVASAGEALKQLHDPENVLGLYGYPNNT